MYDGRFRMEMFGLSAKNFARLKVESRKHITKALSKSVQEFEKTAKQLVPVETGALRDSIEVVNESYNAGKGNRSYVTYIAVGDATPEGQKKAGTIEFGRPGKHVKDMSKVRGTVIADPFMRPTRSLLGERHKRRMRRAINLAIKETVGE